MSEATAPGETGRAADVRQRLGEQTERAQEAYSRVRENVEATAASTKQKASELLEKAGSAYEQVADKSLNDVTEAVGGYVKDKPLKSLLIAAGVGLLAGIMMRRH